MKNARNTVKAKWLAKDRVLTTSEIDEMVEEIEAAAMNALFAHMIASVVVTGAAGPTPVVGTIL